MIDLAAFRVRGPEFKNTLDARITIALADAAARTDASVFGPYTDEAHYWLAAHLLAASPTGRDASLAKDSTSTVYSVERERIENIVGAGWGSL